MRLRQHSRYLTTLAACAVAAAALAGCGHGGSSEAAGAPTATTTTTTTATASTSPAPTSTPTPTPTPAPTPSSPAEPPLIAYAGGESAGVQVHGTADQGKLRGAPQAFQDFIGRTAQRISDESSCADGAVGITVEFLRTDGYAVGGVNDCGGYAALWAVVDGEWRQVQGTQEAWSCRVLRQFRVPSDIVGTTCYDYQAKQERPYDQD